MSTVRIMVKLPKLDEYEDVGYRPPERGEPYRNIYNPDTVEFASYDFEIPHFILRKKQWRAGFNQYYDTVIISNGIAIVYTYNDCRSSVDNNRRDSGNYFKPGSYTARRMAEKINGMIDENRGNKMDFEKDIGIGDEVTVVPEDNDIFTCEFTGFVTGFKEGLVQVCDRDDNVFDVHPRQIDTPDTPKEEEEEEEREFEVNWSIDIPAVSSERAAEDALGIMRDPFSTATVFFVTDRKTGKNKWVDPEYGID